MRLFSALRAARFWPSASLRTYLVATILIASVPLAALLTWQSLVAIRKQQADLEAALERSAASLALAVEHELRGSRDLLRLLASEVQQLPDPREAGALIARLREVPLREGWRSIALVEADGRVLADTEGDAERPRLERLGTAALGATGAASDDAAVSDLLAENGAATMTIAIALPGDPRLLVARLDAGRWQQLLQASAPPPDGYLTLLDRRHRIVARTGPLTETIGRPILPEAQRAVSTNPRGVARLPAVAGGEVYVAWQPIATAGWHAAVAVPAEPLDLAERGAIVRAIGVAAACLLIGLTLALLLARRLIEPLDALASGTVPAGPAGPVLEIEMLRQRLAQAHETELGARSRLETKAAEFETLFDGSPIGLAFAQDPQCRNVVHNGAMDALLGTGGAPLTVLHEGRPLARDEQPLQRAARTGEAVAPMELEIVADDRPTTVVLNHAVPLLNAQGRPRGAIGAAIDITQRKRFEAQLLTADQRLRDSQRLIELAQDAGHVGFFSYDFGSDVLTWSPGQARLFGLAASTVSLAQWVQRLDADHRVHVEERLRRMVALQQERETLDYRITLADGTARWLSSRVVMRYAEGGRAQQMIGVTVDMTEQKEVERERASLVAREQAARLEAERANQAKDEFLAMLGHELRNPLGAIASAVEVMQRAKADSALAGDAREIVARQTRNLARIMDDLLDVARVISGKVLLARAPVDLAALAQRVVETLRMTAGTGAPGEAPHEISVDVEPAWIDADATRIEQVVTNLLTNAVKYTPPGSLIEIGVRAHEGDALLRVRDHGEGIPPHLLPHIFDLFVQGERTLDRRAGGLGIGLTLVQRLVRLHGGTVEAQSSPQGTMFEVRLPLIPTPAETAPTGAAAALRVVPRGVVVIEDNADALRSLTAALELDGHRVESATDGIAGLELILRTRPDAAIVDLGLPGLTGYDVALRSRAGGYAGLLIATSGYGQVSDSRRALKSGFDTLLVKPVDRARLNELLGRAM